ncbi:MAG: hypothetical protein ACREMX_14545 [Gemmatimonadales bacterium]
MPINILLALLGAGAALLLAPKEGVRTRERLGGELRDLQGGAAKALDRIGRELSRRRTRDRREKQLAAIAGLVAGVVLGVLLTPESGSDTRRRIVRTVRGTGGRFPKLDLTESSAAVERPREQQGQDPGRDPEQVL